MTEVLVLLSAMWLTGMTTLDSHPTNLPESADERLLWFIEKLSRQVVDSCWMPPSSDDLRCVYDSLQDTARVTSADIDPFPFYLLSNR